MQLCGNVASRALSQMKKTHLCSLFMLSYSGFREI